MSWFEFPPSQIQGLILGSSVKEKKKVGGTKVHFIFWESPNQLSAPVLLAALEVSNALKEEGLGSSRRELEERSIKAPELGVQNEWQPAWEDGERRMKLQRGEKTYKQEEKINKTSMMVHCNSHT